MTPPPAAHHPPMRHPEYYPHNPHYRPYYYDPHHYHAGWYPTYQPIYPWWIDVAEFGAGFVLGRASANRGLYYYYPSEDYYSGNYYSNGQYYYPYGGTTVNETTIIVQGDGQYADAGEELPQDDGILQGLRVDDSITEAPAGQPRSILNRDLDLTEDGAGEGAEEGMVLTEQEAAEIPKITKEAVDGAWEKIQAGDTLFAQGKISEAERKYTEVTESIGLIPDPWFRLAYLEAARNNYDQAVAHARRGMELSRNWPASPFSLDYMYQGSEDRKKANLATLETAAKNAPTRADLNLLAGLSFYSDGQADKATIYLQKAEKIAPDWKEFVDPMLKNIQEGGKIGD